MEWRIKYYIDEADRCPFDIQFKRLPQPVRTKVLKYIDVYLRSLDPSQLGRLGRVIRYLGNGIYDLIVNFSHFRLRFFFKPFPDHGIILITHGIDKHEQFVDNTEIARALQRCVEMEERIRKGEIEI